MIEEWALLIEKYNIAGARQDFERICGFLFKTLYPNDAKTVKISRGDGGIDIFIGNIGIDPIDVIQCKFFPSFGDSQKDQISKSFNKALNSTDYEVSSWTLCIVNEFTIEENKWWANWKKKKQKKFSIEQDKIILKDGLDLIKLLKENDLYDIAFDQTDSLRIKEIFDIVSNNHKIPQEQVETTLRKSSSALHQVKNFIGNDNNNHIVRDETSQVYNWINDDLKKDSKNVLILTGEKGIGKSAVLKDLYDLLVGKDYFVLGIKADKYFYSNIKDLESNLFLNSITFDSLLKSLNKNKKLIVIIDQIDALSYSITSNREFITTYNRLIAEFQNEDNLRVIISTRNYDLEYDAELSIYNSSKYSKIKVRPLSIENVLDVLSRYSIATPPSKFLELLQIPNNLNAFCSLPNKTKVSYDSISSLKDLFDELWIQLISSQKNKNIKRVLFLVAQRMYDEGIAVGNIYNDDYFDELNYLKSNNLIVENDRKIQFFHQTFYEYCYARQFVEENSSLESYIIDNEQSLYIRSVVKMVIEYLREFNVKLYIKTLERILFENQYRFHLKTLLITCIAIQEKINKHEKEFYLKYILDNKELDSVFITSVYSQDWIQFFIERKIFDNAFDTDKRGIIWSLFVRNINHNPIEVLQYLESIDFHDKQNFISSIVIYVENWKDEKLLQFFTKYILYKDRDSNGMSNIWYYKTLEKIYEHNPEFVYSQIEIPLLKTYDNYQHDMEYSLNELIEKISKVNQVEVFYFLLDVLKKAINKTIFPLIVPKGKIESPFYDSYHSITSLYTIYGQRTIIHHLRVLAESLSELEFVNFFNLNKNENNVNVIKVLIHGLKKRYIKLNHLIIELIKIIEQKNGFKGRDDDFQLVLRDLISESYFTLNQEDKSYIINLYLQMTCVYDVYISKNENGKKTYSLRGFGEKKFAFIKSLPKKFIEENENLKKEYQSLFRKFGDIDHKQSLHEGKSSSGTVGPPLSLSAYEKMNLVSWKKSMLKFNETYRSKVFLKGEMREHSHYFKAQVAKNPDKFYDYINALFDDDGINICYISEGITGLIDGNYDPIKVKVLYKKLIRRNLNNEFTLYANWNAKYFVTTNTIDKEIVEHICNVAKNYDGGEKDLNPNHLLMDSLNSVRGSAIDILLSLYKNKDYEEAIFSTIEKVIEDCNLSIKAAIINSNAYLNHLDIPRAFNIFKKLVATNDSDILSHSINSGQYYNNSFHEEMEDYFISLMENEQSHKINFVIVKSFLEGKKYGLKYYQQFISKGSSSILCALKVAEDYLFNKGKLDTGALGILSQFLENDDIEVAREYESIILRKFKKQRFLELNDFMVAYSKSTVCKKAPKYFLDYLIKCSNEFPDECLELIENINFGREPNIQEAGHYDKEPVQLILGLYSKFISSTWRNKKKVERCLNIFDKMLMHSHLRTNANKAIELLSE